MERPEQWPGVHCAKQLQSGTIPKGTWFDGTSYGKDKHAALAKGQKPKLNKRDYQHSYSIELAPIPVWSALSKAEYRTKIRTLVDDPGGYREKAQKRGTKERPRGEENPAAGAECF